MPSVRNLPKKNDHVFIDLSGPFLDEPLRLNAVKALGAQKCLYGSDGPTGYSDIDGSYDHGKIFLTGLPRWVDPRKEIAPDVDRLPFVDSVMTRKGEITWTYRWP
jgi:hypothetical protein